MGETMVSFRCVICGQEGMLTGVDMPQVELFSGIWQGQHSHTGRDWNRWYEFQLQALLVGGSGLFDGFNSGLELPEDGVDEE